MVVDLNFTVDNFGITFDSKFMAFSSVQANKVSLASPVFPPALNWLTFNCLNAYKYLQYLVEFFQRISL